MEPVSGSGFFSVGTLFKCFYGFSKPVRLFLLVAVLCCCLRGGEALNSSKVTSAGETVILPCHITVSDDSDVPEVEWSKKDLDPDIVFLYRDGCETFAEKNPDYRYRTNLIMNELKNGDLSLRISDVQRSDAGEYICKTIHKGRTVVATVVLIVGAVSEPKLSIVPDGEGGVTLQCNASCWSPLPEITFLNAQRNIIGDRDTKIYQDLKRDCFNATRRLTVHTADRVTCRVHQPEINQTRLAEIHIPDDCFRSCTAVISIAVVEAIIICVCVAFVLWKKRHNLAKHEIFSPQSSHQSSIRSNAASNGQAEPNQNTSAELLSEINKLKSVLHEKDELICRLTNELNDLKAQQREREHGLPTLVNSPSTSPPHTSLSPNQPPDNSPQAAASTSSSHPKSVSSPRYKESKKSRNHSCPVSLTNSEAEPPAAACPSDKARVGRSMSMSEPRTLPNVAALQRRGTISMSNRYSALQKLPEDDAEPLLHRK